MKIIQSYWSKPNITRYEKTGINNTGAWSNNMLSCMSMALSCLKLTEFYDQVELITDVEGKKLLIDILDLPYTQVRTELDDINHFPEHFWAIGKIYSYSLQETPFIHVDHDVFIWKKFPAIIEQADILAQHLEFDYKIAGTNFDDVLKKSPFISDEILKYRKVNKTVNEANAGIIGGNNNTFFKKYCKEAINFAMNNIEASETFKNKGLFNTIFEQYLLYCMSENNNIKIEYLLKEDITDNFRGLCSFHELPYKKWFIHALGGYKRKFRTGEFLAQRLWYEYPNYYQRIIDLSKQGLI